MAQSLVIFLVVLLAGFELGQCMECFQCNSQQDPYCADPFRSNRPPVDCSSQDSINFNRLYLNQVFPGLQDGIAGSPRYCHKIVLRTGTVVRTCLDTNPSDLTRTCTMLDNLSRNFPGELGRQIKECSVCNRDNCNGAGSIAASLPLALLTAVVSYLFYKQ